MTITRREREVLALVAAGHSAPEIAAQLHIAHHTVGHHVARLRRKLGARNSAHVVALAYQHGHLTTGDNP